MFKKLTASILCMIICLNLATANTLAAQEIIYDFSDEAQAEFDKANNFKPIEAQIIEVTQQKPTQTIWEPDSTLNTPTIKKTELEKNIKKQKQEDGVLFEPEVTLTTKEEKSYFDARLVYISKNTPIDARLNATIDSGTVQNNSAVTAELTNDWIVDGILVAPEGSIVSGRFVDTTQAGWAMKNGQIGLEFDKILTPNGSIIPLSANKVFVSVDSSRAMKMARNVAVGALFGTIFGLLTMDSSRILNGAIIGSAGGAISGIATKGENATLPAGTNLKLRLSKDMTAEPYEL